MKLIFCLECHDIIRLILGPRKCKCGKCSGEYVDIKNAVISGPALPLGIDNNNFAEAVKLWKQTKKGTVIAAFTIEEPCRTIKRE